MSYHLSELAVRNVARLQGSRHVEPVLPAYSSYRQHCDVAPPPLAKNCEWANDPGRTSGAVIIIGCAALGLIAYAPQFEWFQSLTGISGWVKFIQNILAVTA